MNYMAKAPLDLFIGIIYCIWLLSWMLIILLTYYLKKLQLVGFIYIYI